MSGNDVTSTLRNKNVTLVLVDVFAAVAHPTRRRLLLLVAREERSAGELASHFRESRPAISRHLRILRDAGLVRVRSERQRQLYRLDAAPLSSVEKWLAMVSR